MDGEAGRGFTERDACPACGGTSHRALVDLPYTAPPISEYLLGFYGGGAGTTMLGELEGIRFTLFQCEDCGMIWQRSTPGSTFLARLYEEWIGETDTFDRDVAAGLGDRLPVVRELTAIIAGLGGPPGGLRVLDFGMGWGRWLLIARGLGCQVWGVELAEEKRRHAAALAIPILGWDEIVDHQFELVNTEQVFEHLVDPHETLLHLCRALAPGGLLKVSVPPGGDVGRRLRANDWNAPKRTRNSLNAVAPLEHLNCYAGRSLLALAERVGLEPVSLPVGAYFEMVSFTGGPRNIAKQVLKPFFPTRGGAYRFFRRAS